MSIPQDIRVYVVDDHPIVRAGLHSIEDIAPHIRIVGEAANVTDAWQGISQLRPDFVLLDIRVRDESGIDLARQIKTKMPGTRVLLLSSFVDDQLILLALGAGVDGYLLKENDAERLVAAIEQVRSGEAVFDDAVRQRMLAPREHEHDRAITAMNCLTTQERRLLAEVAKGKTDKEVAVGLGLSPKTARNYLDRIFTKLGVHTRTEAATIFIQSGRRTWEGG